MGQRSPIEVWDFSWIFIYLHYNHRFLLLWRKKTHPKSVSSILKAYIRFCSVRVEKLFVSLSNDFYLNVCWPETPFKLLCCTITAFRLSAYGFSTISYSVQYMPVLFVWDFNGETLPPLSCTGWQWSRPSSLARSKTKATRWDMFPPWCLGLGSRKQPAHWQWKNWIVCSQTERLKISGYHCSDILPSVETLKASLKPGPF